MLHILVDWENIQAVKGALNGFEKLPQETIIDLIYTENAHALDIAFVEKLLNCGQRPVVNFKKVSAGKQALDLQLATYLGFLIAQDAAKDYIILSKDTGFQAVKAFWDQEKISAVSLASALDAFVRQANDYAEKENAPRQAKEAVAAQNETSGASKRNIRNEVNNAVMRTLAAQKYDQKTIGVVASIASKHYNDYNAKQKIYQELRKAFKDQKGRELYYVIKDVIKPAVQ